MHAGLGLLGGLAVALAVAACGGTGTPTTMQTLPPERIVEVQRPVSPAPALAPEQTAAAALHGFTSERLTRDLDLLRDRLGAEAQLTELTIWDGGYLRATAQDATLPDNLDEHLLRDGAFADPEPVRARGADEFADDLFPLADVGVETIVASVADAQARLPFPGGAVTHLILDRNVFHDGVPALRVYVSSDRRSGYAVYDLRGRFLQVHE